MKLPKSLIRWSIEGDWAGGLRALIARREALQEQRFVEKVQLELGFPFLVLEDLAKNFRPSKEIFFILGSGASVEELGEKAFDEIRAGTSVGINAWTLHSFVPDIYAYEPVANPNSDHFRTLSFLDRPEVIRHQPSVIVLRPRNEIEASQLDQIPAELRRRTYLYGRVNPYTRQAKNLSADIEQVLRFLGKIGGPFVALDSGATVVRMACLGILLGFKKIVFVGVDLHNTDYFWQVNPTYLRERGLSSFDSEQKWQVHETEMEGFAPFVATTMIRALADVAREHFGAEFVVASKNSKLASFMPVYTPLRESPAN